MRVEFNNCPVRAFYENPLAEERWLPFANNVRMAIINYNAQLDEDDEVEMLNHITYDIYWSEDEDENLICSFLCSDDLGNLWSVNLFQY